MTAAELLRSAEPPADDGIIDQALTDLDVKIWTWTDAMLSAQAFLKRTLSSRDLLGNDAVAARAHVAPQPAAPVAPPVQQFAPPPAAGNGEDWRPVAPPAAAPEQGWAPTPQGAPAPGAWTPAPSSWERPVQQPHENWGAPQPMQWPSSPGEWSSAPAAGPATNEWPTASWPSSESSGVALETKPVETAPPLKKVKEKPVKVGPSDEELAARAAHEQEVLSGLDETTARRVRLLRRLDPDSKIEALVEKARQTSAEPNDKNDKSSWWRRK